MYNKKPLREAIKKLDKAKAPAKKRDIILNQEGQRKYPGQVTKILGDTMATDGYGDIPLMVYPNNGQPPQLVEANTGPRYFPGATEFTEVPVIKAYGGDISIPDLNQYEDGGEYDLTDDQIAELEKGGYIVEELPKAQEGKNKHTPVRGSMKTHTSKSGTITNKFLDTEGNTVIQVKKPDGKYYEKVLSSYDYGAIDPKTFVPSTAKKDIIESAKDVASYYSDYMKSPRYNEMLYGNDQQGIFDPSLTQINKNRNYNLQSFLSDPQKKIQFSKDVNGDNRTAGYSSSITGDITILPRGLTTKGVLAHEMSHSIDKPTNFITTILDSRNIPRKDIEYISKHRTPSEAIWTKPGLKNINVKAMGKGFTQAEKDWTEYVTDPTETRARLNDIRYQSKKQGIYDPFTQRVTPAIYKKLQETNFGDLINPFKELKDEYSDEEILWMLNNISKNDNKSIENQYDNFENDRLSESEFGGLLKKGGYVSMPKKKGSKGYSRSLMATNQLFAQNPLLKKQKSKKRKIFDPNAKYYQDGGEAMEMYDKGGFHDDINKHRDLLRDWTYGESIGMLEKAQKGKFKFKRLSRKEEEAARFNEEEAMRAKEAPVQAPVEATVPEQSFDYWAGGPGIYPTEKDLPAIDVTARTEDLVPGHWLRYKREFQKTNPYSDFASERKKKYLRRSNQALNKLAGVSEKNFPEKAENRIKSAYDEKMNTYIFERMGQDLGFNPKDRTTWGNTFLDPDFLATGYGKKIYEIIYNSKYGSKIEPSVWSKFLSGSQQFANVLLPREIELNKKIPGYTERENIEAQTSWSEPLNIFEPSYLIGNYFANLAHGSKEIAGTEGRTRPSLMSGEINPEVGELSPLILDPTVPFQLISSPLRSVGKTLLEGAKTTGRSLKGTIEAGKAYQNVIKPSLQTTAKILDTPLGKGQLSELYQRKVLGLPEWQIAFNAAQAPKTAIQAASTPANLLRAQTMGTGLYKLPQVAQAVSRDYNTIISDETSFTEKTSAMRDLSRNAIMEGLALSPLAGARGLKLYQSNPATYAYLLDNLSKLKNYDPEAARAWLNAARIATGTKKRGGPVYEIDNSTRRVLAKLGYQVEDVD